jgi:hypothetical protein
MATFLRAWVLAQERHDVVLHAVGHGVMPPKMRLA